MMGGILTLPKKLDKKASEKQAKFKCGCNPCLCNPCECESEDRVITGCPCDPCECDPCKCDEKMTTEVLSKQSADEALKKELVAECADSGPESIIIWSQSKECSPKVAKEVKEKCVKCTCFGCNCVECGNTSCGTAQSILTDKFNPDINKSHKKCQEHNGCPCNPCPCYPFRCQPSKPDDQQRKEPDPQKQLDGSKLDPLVEQSIEEQFSKMKVDPSVEADAENATNEHTDTSAIVEPEPNSSDANEETVALN